MSSVDIFLELEKEKIYIRTSVKIEKEEHENLQKLCRRRGLIVSTVINRLIADFNKKYAQEIMDLKVRK